MKRIVENKHPLAIRWFHWVNFPVLAVMIWSGLLIYWAYHPYKIEVGSVQARHVLPGVVLQRPAPETPSGRRHVVALRPNVAFYH